MEIKEINIQKTKKVIITIEDDGPGIPEDQYKNVFKPFLGLIKVGLKSIRRWFGISYCRRHYKFSRWKHSIG